MKNLKKYEEFSEDRINDILDKMNRKEPLTKEEEWILKNPDADVEEQPNYKESLIDNIKTNIEKYCDGTITTGQLESSSSPVYTEHDNEIHLIEIFYIDDVTITIYGGYKYETILGEYDIPYEDLSMENLEEINELINDYIAWV